ncbi:MAG: hypothetical protein H7330_02035, partial [Hymenobacteraceae bacterium]|nr:hypothetical protein [Hymenobacteraceae bacterium]
MAFLALLLGVLATVPARAEPWQRDPVLSQLLIKQLLTDPTGFQWIATDEGVFRYDGYELVPLARLVRPGSVAAPKGMASTLCLDPTGHLWLGTDAGLFCLTLRTGALRHIVLSQKRGYAQPTVTRLFLHPRSGHLWVSYNEGTLVVLDAARGSRVISRGGLPGVGFLCQSDGTPTGVWVSFVHGHYFDPVARQERVMLPGVARLGLTGPARQYLPTPFPVVPVPGSAPLRLFCPSALYEVTDHGELREIKRWLPPGRDDNFWPAFTHADSVAEWVSQHRYLRLTVRGPCAGEITADSLRLPDALNYHHHEYLVFQDALGAQWCYSRSWRGVYKRRAAAPRVVRALLPADVPTTPSTRGIARLADGRLFLGSYSGSFVQAADSPRAPLRRLRFSRPGSPVLVAYDALTTHASPPATTVLAEEEIGFSVLDPRTGAAKLLPLDPGERHRPFRFRTLAEDSQGYLWGGTDSGLFLLDLRAARVRRYRPPGGVQQLPLLQIQDLAPDPSTGHLWLATQQGLYWLAPATGELRRVGAVAPARALPTDNLLCVAAVGPGRAWVGTRADGLLLVDARRGLVQQLSIADGLPSATIATVLCRADGAVWAGTYAGLIRYDPARQRLAIFGEAAGLTEAELNRNSAYADPRTGALLFGGVGGVFQVAPTTMGQAETDRQR